MERLLRKFKYVRELEKKYIDLQVENIDLRSADLETERKNNELLKENNYLKDIIAAMVSTTFYAKHNSFEVKAVISKANIKKCSGKLKIESLFPEEKIQLIVKK